MTRRGKIARLPLPIREQVNRRLQDGEPSIQIVAWLNSLPEVAALLAAEFDSQPVNEPNLSHWKLGGFLDWLAHQDALEAVRHFNDDAAELCAAASTPAHTAPLVPEPQLADQLALWIAARFAIALQKSLSDGQEPAAQLDLLRQFNKDIALLRRGDHRAQWLRIESGKLNLFLKKLEHQSAARNNPDDPQVRLPRPEGGFSKETIAKIIKDLEMF